MKKIILLHLSLLLSSALLVAQHQNIEIGPTQGFGIPGEPAVCMNPANPDQIMVGAMSDNYYITEDGGYSWTHGILQSAWGVSADPVILCDPNGQFYYLHLPDVIQRVVCHRKDDIAAPWSPEVSVAFNGTHDVDKEWATYDPVNDRIYLSWTYFDTWGSANPNDSSCIYISWSGDQGESWVDPVRISDEKGNAQGGSYSMHGSYPTTGPNGEVYITWWGPDGLMFDRSLDMGTTWLPEDICITNQHIEWIYPIQGINLGVSFPVISCDRSGGPHDGTIYITWADKRNGYNNTDVFVVMSSDNGTTWSDAIQVNDDGTTTHQFFPYLTVDQATGKVWLVFYDRRNHSNTTTDVYMAVSEDGGETYENFRVSEAPFTPNSTAFYGHYIGLTAHDDHVLPVWMRMDDGYSSIIGAIVNPLIIGDEELYEAPVATLINSPNPFTESSFILFKLKQPSTVSIHLYDVTGNLVTTVIDRREFPIGKHVEKIDARALGLQPGAYIVKLNTGTSIITRKVICVN